MDREKTSRTEKDSFVEERIIGTHHYKTTISDDRHKVEGRGRTAEEAEERASDEWDRLYGDDEDED
jgi:predicted metal-dependent hydrolase